MKTLRHAIIVLLAICAAAQDVTFHTTVPAVLVPVTVTDKKGHYINGLSAADFTVLDNGTPREIKLDTSDTTTIPLAVVFVVQADDVAATALMKIQKIGAEIQPLITGERGHAAIIAFGAKPSLVQGFTSEPEELSSAFQRIKPEDDRAAAMLDAVAESATLLGMRPTNERRIVIMIGESRDRGSKTKVEKVVDMLQRQAITVFPIVYSAYVTPFTTKGSDMPPPSGGDGGILGIITEAGRLGKTNAAVALASDSGGRKLSFATLRGLEREIGVIGEELHSQYLLSYTAPDGPPGYHKIEVHIPNHPGATIRSRPGYWIDEK